MKKSNMRIAGICAILLFCTLFATPVSASDEEDYWLYTGVWDYLSAGRYDEAIEAFDKVISINPDNAAAYHNKGVALYNMNEYQKALEQFQMAMSRVSWFANPYSRGYLWEYTGKTLDKLGRNTDAIPAYEESLRNVPDKGEVWTLLVTDLQITGDLKNAAWINDNVYLFFANGSIGADTDKGYEYLRARPVHNTSDYYGAVPPGETNWFLPLGIGLIVVIVIIGAIFIMTREKK